MFWNLFKRPIHPYHKGFLPTKDGHDIFFQQFGNAAADNRKTILVFHGGPGGSSKYKHTLHYNLKKYRVILFDQRGCGQSICANALYQNTTNDLLDDANRLLNHLQITGKIIVGGGSWGSTLALLFAQKYPHRVSKLVLNSIFLANTSDLQWMPQTSRLFYPDFIDRFRKIAGTQDIGPFFAKLLLSKNKKDKDLALATYASYERVLGSVNPQLPTGPFKESDRAYPLIFSIMIRTIIF